jgi:hypothetical protein
MKVINARNVNSAWNQAKGVVSGGMISRPSRNGDVLEYRDPVATVYQKPNERVLFDARRDANPFFHMFEAMWMLAGRDDLAAFDHVNMGHLLRPYSDNGETVNGAYGYRWRNYFNQDQLGWIIGVLRLNPDDRRCVLTMWDGNKDLTNTQSKDVPCNTQIYFKLRPVCQGTPSKLLMTVCNRSNDIVFGCYGANAVHMSFLHEYMAAMLGVPMGEYTQISDSWHAYLDTWEKFGGKEQLPDDWNDPYVPWYHGPKVEKVSSIPLVTNPALFDMEVRRWVESPTERGAYYNEFFYHTATPMMLAWTQFKAFKQKAEAMDTAELIEAPDWRLACINWLKRRQKTAGQEHK